MIKEKKTGQVIVISSPSGAGKSSIVKALLERDNNLWLSVSTTTRAIRPGEKEGVNYNYVDKEEFIKKIDEGYFLEYTNYTGNYYGTPKKFIKENCSFENNIDKLLKKVFNLPQIDCDSLYLNYSILKYYGELFVREISNGTIIINDLKDINSKLNATNNELNNINTKLLKVCDERLELINDLRKDKK